MIILENYDFKNISLHRNIIPDENGYNKEDITFSIALNRHE
jgi:hypothetical protein